ncbi:hypothetical protein BX257_5290 [Streptomyces sp. 3212.3]|nr:hypothetical protein BX257_5290 [Streptomyces sp. 3212.3]
MSNGARIAVKKAVPGRTGGAGRAVDGTPGGRTSGGAGRDAAERRDAGTARAAGHGVARTTAGPRTLGACERLVGDTATTSSASAALSSTDRPE